MGNITVFTNLSLDGVYQAPGRADEDTRGGFSHGGWATPYQAMTEAGNLLGNPGELLFGRWTFELFHASWGGQKGNPFSAFFDATPKHVVTGQSDYQPQWQSSHVVTGDTDSALTALHRGPTDYLVFGSGQLVTRLAELGLVDRYILLVHPLVLGAGHRFGLGLNQKQSLKLDEVRSTSTGVLIATYSIAAPGILA